MSSWILILFLWFIIHYYYLFRFPEQPRFGQWELLQAGFDILLTLLCRFLHTSILFGIRRCPKYVLYIPIFSPGVSHFSKDPWFLLVGNGIQKPRSVYQIFLLLPRKMPFSYLIFNLTFCCFSLCFFLYIVFTNLKLNHAEICIPDFSFNSIM